MKQLEVFLVFGPIRNRIWPSKLREMFFDPIQSLVGFNMVHWQGVDKKNVILFRQIENQTWLG
jgi:hypothetical protein